MIAVDTNVLVRFLVHDDQAQSSRATALFRRAQRSDEPVFVPDLVLAETVWVLLRAYRVPKADVVRTLTDLVRARHVRFESPTQVERAIASFARSRGDFVDYLIREHAQAADCEAIATFDESLWSEPGFVRP
jgi:predicted nucleic-acid-binding protein